MFSKTKIALSTAMVLSTNSPASAAYRGTHVQTLSFPEFVEFATATVDQRIDIHWQLQEDLATVPGLPLNLIGKVESFQTDFARVSDHIGVTNEARARYLQQAVNPSSHEPWQEYYTDALAARVYRAYERVFDKFGYPRTVK